MSGHHHGSVLLADEQVSIDLSNHEPSKSLMQTQALMYDETVSLSNSLYSKLVYKNVYIASVDSFGS